MLDTWTYPSGHYLGVMGVKLMLVHQPYTYIYVGSVKTHCIITYKKQKHIKFSLSRYNLKKTKQKNVNFQHPVSVSHFLISLLERRL